MSDNENIEKLSDDELDEISGGKKKHVQYDRYDVYTVKPNDTFWKIANRYGVSMEFLGNLNNVYPPYYIHIGQELFVPKKD